MTFVPSTLTLIGRDLPLFDADITANATALNDVVAHASFLVLGGAGSIGQAVVKEIIQRRPKKIHVVDISENNLVELVRDIRSQYGDIGESFKTYALDIGSTEFDAFFDHDGHYDYLVNLSALKHVRSEKDPYTLMRMLNVNIFNTQKTLKLAINKNIKHYFCVSTDKAADPVNVMGASKKIMEWVLMQYSKKISISTARFANVAFSDGSLLCGFEHRLRKKQPIVAPNDIQRYFLTPEEAGQLCLMACIFGKNRELYFPLPSDNMALTTFPEIAKNVLKAHGYHVHSCTSEDDARQLIKTLPQQGKWPCLFNESNTTGEKPIEQFYTDTETPEYSTYKTIGILHNSATVNTEHLNIFEQTISALQLRGQWTKNDILAAITTLLPTFKHYETGQHLDSKM
ncbi:UDP-N-acetylglucosamine 4,6-dehydratase [Teredinibacter purpureus]|uniref:UDP-N-acetylglucosamine 4,6-dehydratase n=1 Tax=Teredinibacter purpureus TaxID=2731756 RepID=UPI000A3F56E3|nr:UDP-N-acetylglucosamine 4,6-dehydratase [Teredinibacter purpureus]